MLQKSCSMVPKEVSELKSGEPMMAGVLGHKDNMALLRSYG